MKGTWFSSTRIELAAAIMASLAEIPIPIASDSLSFVTKATKLIAEATRRMKNQTTTWWQQHGGNNETL